MPVTTHDLMLTWVSLVHVGSHLPAELSQFLQRELGISLAEQDLLKQLQVGGGELKLVELSRRIYLSKAGVTKMMDRLERSGFVERVRSDSDRRAVMAQLTKEGAAVLTRSRALLVPWVEKNLRQHLGDEQLVDLKNALQVLLEGHGRWEGQMAHLAGGSSEKKKP